MLVSAPPELRGSAPSRAPDPAPESGTHECRCGCGSLLARLRPDGVELKCRRCKRIVILPFAELSLGEEGAPQPIG